MGKSILVLLFRLVLIMRIGDKHAQGAITVKFDTGPDNWSTAYQAFITWIKSHVLDVSIIT